MTNSPIKKENPMADKYPVYNVRLSDEQRSRLSAIGKYLGGLTDAAVVKFLIAEKYEALAPLMALRNGRKEKPAVSKETRAPLEYVSGEMYVDNMPKFKNGPVGLREADPRPASALSGANETARLSPTKPKLTRAEVNDAIARAAAEMRDGAMKVAPQESDPGDWGDGVESDAVLILPPLSTRNYHLVPVDETGPEGEL